MRRDRCTFSEAMLSLTAVERGIVYGNVTPILEGFLASFVEPGAALPMSVVLGCGISDVANSVAAVSNGYRDTAIAWLNVHPKTPQAWDDLSDLSGLINWKGRNLIRDSFRADERAQRKHRREYQRSNDVLEDPRYQRVRALFIPGGVEGFRLFLISRGGKLDLDALAFYDQCCSDRGAFRPSEKRGVTYNIPAISAALEKKTGTAWPHHRVEHARIRFLERLDEFEGSRK